ncbi:MAG: heparan-alpha-glucosaminide N-acetyltransferase domain-containing protein [Gemmataceae bacterium]
MRAQATHRQPSIDLLRAIAITLMVMVHFVENLSGQMGSSAGASLAGQAVWVLPSGFAAPIFTFLSGTSYRIWVRAQMKAGRGEDSITKASVRRGLFLFGLGFVFNVLVWLPEDVFNWDVLTLIGTGILALAALRHAPDGVLLLAAGLMAVLAQPLQEAAGYSEYWTEGYFDPDPTLTEVTLGWLVTGYFPLCPWLAYPLAGYALGPTLFGPTGKARPRVGIVSGVSLLLVGAGMLIGGAGTNLAAWTMFPPTPAYIACTMGCVLAGACCARDVLARWPWLWERAGGWIEPLSRHSLSIYLLHHLAHIWPLWAYGAWNGPETTAYWQRAMGPAASFGLACCFMVGVTLLFRWVDRNRLPSMETLMRWICE